MGTFYTPGATKKDIIAEVASNSENGDYTHTVLRKCCIGNVVWTVQEVVYKRECNSSSRTGKVYKIGEVVRFIGCYLLSKVDGDWGYKPMDESVGPCYYTCPTGYFKLVPVVNQEWRDKVFS